MSDPPLQGSQRFIAIDLHKHYLMVGGIDAHKQVVLRAAVSSTSSAFRIELLPNSRALMRS